MNNTTSNRNASNNSATIAQQSGSSTSSLRQQSLSSGAIASSTSTNSGNNGTTTTTKDAGIISKQKQLSLQDMPFEILDKILSYVDYKQVSNMRLVSSFKMHKCTLKLMQNKNIPREFAQRVINTWCRAYRKCLLFDQ